MFFHRDERIIGSGVSEPRDRVEMTQTMTDVTRLDGKVFIVLWQTIICPDHQSFPMHLLSPSLSLCPRAFLFNFYSWDPEFAQIRLRASGGGVQIFASWLWIDFFLWSCRSEVVLSWVEFWGGKGIELQTKVRKVSRYYSSCLFSVLNVS